MHKKTQTEIQSQGTGSESPSTEAEQCLDAAGVEILRYLARLRKAEAEFYLYLLGREKELGPICKALVGSFGSWLDRLNIMNAKEWLDFKSGYGQLNGYLSRHPVTIDDQAYLTDEVVCLFGVPGVKRLRSLRKAENLPAVIRDLVDHMRENEGVRPSDETVRLKQQLRGVVPYESRGDKRARRDTEAEVKAKESTARAKVAEQAQREAERQRDLAEREAKARAQAAERAQLEAERERDLAVERAAKVEAAILKPMVSTAPSNVPQSEADRLEADLHRIELEIRSTEAALKILRQRAKTVRGSLAALRPVAAAS